MNTQLIKHWVSSWSNDHECTTISELDAKSFGAATFRVIDVEESRIAQLTTCRYLALSYVWGDVMSKLSTSKTRDPVDGNFLNHDKLPRTIRDAIRLTKLLGERYLWADWLCIDQNDEKDKFRLVYHMHSIYQSAALTIIAAAVKDAEAGLPAYILAQGGQKRRRS